MINKITRSVADALADVKDARDADLLHLTVEKRTMKYMQAIVRKFFFLEFCSPYV